MAHAGHPERHWWRGRFNLVTLLDVTPVESRRLCTHWRTIDCGIICAAVAPSDVSKDDGIDIVSVCCQ